MAQGSDGLSIAFVSLRYPPETGAGSTRVRELTTRWAEAGHDVTVITSAPDYPDGELYDGYANEWFQRQQLNGVTVLMTRTIPASNDDSLFRRAAKYLWFAFAATIVGLRSNPPDVVVATSPQPFAGLAGWFIGAIHRVPFVFDVRDLWPESLVAMTDLENALVVRLLGWMVDFLYARADSVNVVAPGMRDVVVERGADPGAVWNHPNGVDPDFFAVDDSPTVPECEPGGLLEDRFVVSHIGTVGRAQGLSFVLDAAERLQSNPDYGDVLFVFVGFGNCYDDLRRLADQRGLENVAFLGKRPREEVPVFLRNSDAALVHTEADETFETMIPMKMYEAMGAGVPVILGASGDAETILKQADGGIFMDHEDAVGLVDAIKRLYDDSETRTRLGENAKRYVLENHTWDGIAKAYADDLESLVVGGN